MPKGWITPAEAEERAPGFFEGRGTMAWRCDPENLSMESDFGWVQTRVAVNDEGKPEFDRAIVGEAPGMFAVVYGVDSEGIYHIGVVEEARPFADNPDGTPADPPIRFGQPCVVGLMDKLIGEGASEIMESPEAAATREAWEEAGIKDILSVEHMGYTNPNPALVATYDQLIEIEVDLDMVAEHGGGEARIYRAHYVPVRTLMDYISMGEHEGVNYRAAAANHAFLVWLARHPHALQS